MTTTRSLAAAAALTLCLTACGSTTDSEATPPEAPAWIEVEAVTLTDYTSLDHQVSFADRIVVAEFVEETTEVKPVPEGGVDTGRVTQQATFAIEEDLWVAPESKAGSPSTITVVGPGYRLVDDTPVPIAMGGPLWEVGQRYLISLAWNDQDQRLDIFTLDVMFLLDEETIALAPNEAPLSSYTDEDVEPARNELIGLTVDGLREMLGSAERYDEADYTIADTSQRVLDWAERTGNSPRPAEEGEAE